MVARILDTLTSSVGSRVTIRLHDPEGGFRDLLGILESPSTVRKRDGSLASFRWQDIFVWKVVPEKAHLAGTGSPRSLRIMELEDLAEATWPAPEIEEFGGWRFRAGSGFTRRANSVRPRGKAPYGEPGHEFGKSLDHVVQFYAERGLPPVFHVALPVYAELDDVLEEYGWKTSIEAHVMIADRKTFENFHFRRGNYFIHVLNQPSDRWLDIQGDRQGKAIMASYPSQYVAIEIDGAWVAAGRISDINQWGVISRLYVQPEFRRTGLAVEILCQLIAHSNADKFMLQVDIKNGSAISLYEKFEFHVHHNYRYRQL